jgi:hypothetical protein
MPPECNHMPDFALEKYAGLPAIPVGDFQPETLADHHRRDLCYGTANYSRVPKQNTQTSSAAGGLFTETAVDPVSATLACPTTPIVPLTAIWTPPCGPQSFNPAKESRINLACLPPDYYQNASNCLPRYSPAICPSGYTPACTPSLYMTDSEPGSTYQGPPLNSSETAWLCAPR